MHDQRVQLYKHQIKFNFNESIHPRLHEITSQLSLKEGRIRDQLIAHVCYDARLLMPSTQTVMEFRLSLYFFANPQ